jgi:hypothetical protein
METQEEEEEEEACVRECTVTNTPAFIVIVSEATAVSCSHSAAKY